MSSLYGYVGATPSPGGDDPAGPGGAASSPGSRTLGIVAIVVMLAIGVGYLGMRAVRDRGESIHRIRSHPARFESQPVTIRGRAGESFQVGASWAYFLHQGGDTIVVFSRTGAPRPNETVSIRGSISMGYLDGQPRPALFESTR